MTDLGVRFMGAAFLWLEIPPIPRGVREAILGIISLVFFTY